MNVTDFCSREVATVAPHDSLREASFTMRNRHVGALVVIDEARRPVGIVMQTRLARAFGGAALREALARPPIRLP
jgi:CBS-domain-containing membrane protein